MYRISLTENDFLEYQLYTASKSKRIKKNRRLGWILITSSFVILALLFYSSDNSFLKWYFIVIGLLTLLFYPIYQKRRYKKHFLGHIRENYRNKMNVEGILEFNEESIMTSDKYGEGTLKLSELAEIIELPNHIFIKTEAGETIIIPKRKIDLDQFKSELTGITKAFNIPWNEELEWKWS